MKRGPSDWKRDQQWRCDWESTSVGENGLGSGNGNRRSVMPMGKAKWDGARTVGFWRDQRLVFHRRGMIIGREGKVEGKGRSPMRCTDAMERCDGAM